MHAGRVHRAGVADSRPGLLARGKSTLAALRANNAAVDHAFRAYQRFDEARGNRLAASVTYFGFLSFFPLLALGFAALGYVVEVYPDARAQVTDLIEEAFPGLIGTGDNQINVQDIADARAGVGVLALLGLLYAGLGWVDALREALRMMWQQGPPVRNFVVRKVFDAAVLGTLGVGLLLSVVVSSLSTSATRAALDLVGWEDSTAAAVLLKVLAVTLALVADTVIFLILFARLPGVRTPWRRVFTGALLAAVGFEVLKVVGTFLIGRTTTNPLYGTFAVIVGLLIWMNLVSRFLLFAAAWTVTTPFAVQATVPEEAVEPQPGTPVSPLQRRREIEEAGAARRERRLGSPRGLVLGLVGVVGLLIARRRRKPDTAER